MNNFAYANHTFEQNALSSKKFIETTIGSPTSLSINEIVAASAENKQTSKNTVRKDDFAVLDREGNMTTFRPTNANS